MKMANIQNNVALVLGVGGQDGFYLSKHLLELGYSVIGAVRRSSQSRDYLNSLVEIGLTLIEFDVTDYTSVEAIIKEYKPAHVYNLAAQSHVATSFKQPHYTSDVNYGGVLNILEAIRTISPHSRFYQASTSEMFGKSVSERKIGYLSNIDPATGLDSNGNNLPSDKWNYKFTFPENTIGGISEKYQDENTPFIPQSPYAIAKLAAHESVRLYREAYGLFACCGILFNHESEHRGTQFVTRKVTRYIAGLVSSINKLTMLVGGEKSIKNLPKLKLGNLDACRDWSHAEDLVKAMVLMLEADKPVDYVCGSGETHSVREFVDAAFKAVNLNWEDWVEIDQSLIRPAEVEYLRSDPSKIKKELGWEQGISFQGLVERMVKYDIDQQRYLDYMSSVNDSKANPE